MATKKSSKTKKRSILQNELSQQIEGLVIDKRGYIYIRGQSKN